LPHGLARYQATPGNINPLDPRLRGDDDFFSVSLAARKTSGNMNNLTPAGGQASVQGELWCAASANW
jgi:hypothetical protein